MIWLGLTLFLGPLLVVVLLFRFVPPIFLFLAAVDKPESKAAPQPALYKKAAFAVALMCILLIAIVES